MSTSTPSNVSADDLVTPEGNMSHSQTENLPTQEQYDPSEKSPSEIPAGNEEMLQPTSRNSESDQNQSLISYISPKAEKPYLELALCVDAANQVVVQLHAVALAESLAHDLLNKSLEYDDLEFELMGIVALGNNERKEASYKIMLMREVMGKGGEITEDGMRFVRDSLDLACRDLTETMKSHIEYGIRWYKKNPKNFSSVLDALNLHLKPKERKFVLQSFILRILQIACIPLEEFELLAKKSVPVRGEEEIRKAWNRDPGPYIYARTLIDARNKAVQSYTSLMKSRGSENYSAKYVEFKQHISHFQENFVQFLSLLDLKTYHLQKSDEKYNRKLKEYLEPNDAYAELIYITKDYSRLLEEEAAIRAERDSWKERSLTLGTENEAANKALRDLEEESRCLKEDKDGIEAKLTSTEEALYLSQLEGDALKQQLDSAENKRDDTEITALKQQLESAEKERDDMEIRAMEAEHERDVANQQAIEFKYQRDKAIDALTAYEEAMEYRIGNEVDQID